MIERKLREQSKLENCFKENRETSYIFFLSIFYTTPPPIIGPWASGRNPQAYIKSLKNVNWAVLYIR